MFGKNFDIFAKSFEKTKKKLNQFTLLLTNQFTSTMKKLALALVCLMGVAFFASCDPENVVENPEPSIAVIAEEGYLTDGQVIEMFEIYSYGFKVASNPDTQKELAKLVVKCNDEIICDSVISGTEFEYRDEISVEPAEREIVGSVEITATVTDAAGKVNTATIKVDVNQEEPLVVSTIEWVKWGHSVEDLSAYGLVMHPNNYKDVVYVHIIPAEGCTLYVVENDEDGFFEAIETASNLAGYFMMLAEDPNVSPCLDYNHINCTAGARYNDLLVTKDAEGNFHIIHITGTDVAVVSPNGTKITIHGEAK